MDLTTNVSLRFYFWRAWLHILICFFFVWHLLQGALAHCSCPLPGSKGYNFILFFSFFILDIKNWSFVCNIRCLPIQYILWVMLSNLEYYSLLAIVSGFLEYIWLPLIGIWNLAKNTSDVFPTFHICAGSFLDCWL